jgi:hypothetical protein
LKKRIIVLPFVIGMTFSIPLLILYWTFFKSFFNNWTGAGLYFYHFFNRDGLTGFYAIIILSLNFLFFAPHIKESRLREITAYLSGLYFSIALYDSIMSENWYGTLELFLIPLVRVSTILIIAIMISRSLKERDWKKYLWMGLSLLVPVFTTFVPVFYVLNSGIYSVVFTLILLSCSIPLYLLETKHG